MIISRQKIQRMVNGNVASVSGSGGSGSSGGGGGSAGYASEAGHAQEADHATSADTATEATHATSATTATTAQNLASDSTDWQKIADKTIVQTIAEVWTFAKGIISTLRSYFNGGATVSKAQGDTGKALVVTGGTQTDTMDASGNATVGGTLGVTGKLNGHEADFSDVTINNLGKSTDRVTKIWSTDIDAKNIGTETLNVSKEAYFTKLVVNELLSNKGAIIISSANCVAEIVNDIIYYSVYFSAVDADGNPVSNAWRKNDMALCLTFKGEGAGTFADVRNRYYWRRVTNVGTTTIDNVSYHYIMLSKTDGEGSTVPAAGDHIVQLGYTGSDAASAYRQSAVILSAYPTMDTGLTPPALAFYKGINDYSLSSHRYTYIDGLSNEFIGNFKILVNGSYTNLTTVLTTIEGIALSVQSMVRGKNILPLDRWTDANGNLLGSNNFQESDQYYSNNDGFGNPSDVLWSPIVFLKAGTYTYSHYCLDGTVQLYLYGNDKNFLVGDAHSLISLFSDPVDAQVSGDTYMSCPRRYITFTLYDDYYVCLDLYHPNDVFEVYRPMLEEVEEGSAIPPSLWEPGSTEHVSQVKILSDSIDIAIRSGLAVTGINIINRTINLMADKVTFQNSDGTVSGMVSIDTTKGTLITKDAVLNGNLFLPYTRLTSANISQYQTANFAGELVIALGKSGNNLQVEISGAYIRLPRITEDMLGCEVNIWNLSSGDINITGSGNTTSQSADKYFVNIIQPSVAVNAGTNSQITLHKLYEAKFKAVYTGYASYQQYAWLCCLANANP